MSDALEQHRRAGRIAAQALQFGAGLIVPGARVVEILDKVEAFIAQQGAACAFPAQISINQVAAHYCPLHDDPLEIGADDMVKLDVGVHVEGHVGDNAVTVYTGTDPKRKLLVEASRAARDAAIALVRDGVTPHDLGQAIEREITSRGFQPIRNLSGHGVAPYVIHTEPSIPNFANNDRAPLRAGMTIAIEPFASTGAGRIVQKGEATVFAVGHMKSLRAPMAKDVIERIKSYGGLPFTTRWLTREFGEGKTRLALFALKNAGLLESYPPLPDANGGIVSQSEHTMLVLEDGCEILTRAD